MRIDHAVIDRSVEEGSRHLVVALLRQSDDAARRLASGEDEEALHDFRVGLRRLRTALRSFSPWLEGSVRRRDEKRLRKLAKGSNVARDAEVHLAFLQGQELEASPRHRLGLAFMRERLEARRRQGIDVDQILATYRRLSRKLAARVPRYEIRLDDAASTATFGAALAAAVSEQLVAVRTRADAIAGPDDQERVHETRIAVKRLRYLLEPLRGNPHADARAAVRELKRLQDVLGDLHDAHTLSHELEAALLDATAERSRHLFAAAYVAGARGAALRELRGGPRAGVLALVRIIGERRDALFAALEHTWRAGGLDALAAEIERITSALELRAGGRLEVLRRYVLSALPQRAEAAAALEISEGWLPGEAVRERLRAVRTADGERYWRDFVQGTGSRRVHVEEETTRDVFAALWSLTEGRRETRRRREVSDENVTWWIDELPERHLIVAEALLSPSAARAPLPAWLLPFVVRELSEDGHAAEAQEPPRPGGEGEVTRVAAGESSAPDGAAPLPH